MYTVHTVILPTRLELSLSTAMKILDTLSTLMIDMINSIMIEDYDKAYIHSTQMKKLNIIVDDDTMGSDLYFDTVFHSLFHVPCHTATGRTWILTAIDLLKDVYAHHENVIADICK